MNFSKNIKKFLFLLNFPKNMQNVRHIDKILKVLCIYFGKYEILKMHEVLISLENRENL